MAHPYKAQGRAKREARAQSERQARKAFERRAELAPLAHAAHKVARPSSLGVAILAAFEREGL